MHAATFFESRVLKLCRILVLDEPTGWMDAEAEEKFYRQLEQIKKGKIVLAAIFFLELSVQPHYGYILYIDPVKSAWKQIELLNQKNRYAPFNAVLLSFKNKQ